MTNHAQAPHVDLLELARNGEVHFMGVSGAGMSALARLMLGAGGRVSGCDLRPGTVADALAAHGMNVLTGHDAAHVADASALVITSAVRRDHPEVLAARERGIPVLKRAEALGAVVNRGHVVAIAGTHGKTTTTAAATAILDAAGLEPTGLVGGHMPAWGGGYHAGRDEIYVVEADEYDRSFHTLQPSSAVVTNVEADHLDIYGDLEGLEEGFRQFLSQVREDGIIAVCSDDAGALRIARQFDGPTPVLLYGTGEDADLRATDVRQDGRSMRFTVVEHGESLGEFTVASPGLHNVRNALGAFAAARHAGAGFSAAAQALRGFTGVARRFQELGTAGGVTVVDDYAHHPTEIEATLQAARGTYPGRRIIAAFQPHLYSRTRDHSGAFGKALRHADVVWVTDVYAAREEPIPGVNGNLVAAAARDAGAADVRYAPTLDELRHALNEELKAGDVLVAMGAGDIDSVAHALFASLQEAGA